MDTVVVPPGETRAETPRRVRKQPGPTLASVREFLRLRDESPRRFALGHLFGRFSLDRATARAYAGALAEIEVVERLDRLDAEWTVLDAVPVGFDEDPVEHLVIGPPGVFTISLRNHAGESVWVGERTFVADSIRFPHVHDAEREADLVAERMSAATGERVSVTPCIVVAAPEELILREGGRRVEAFVPGQFGSWLAELPRVLSPEAVQKFRSAALRSQTWFEFPAGDSPFELPGDATELRDTFEGIRRGIVRAKRLRVAWVLFGFAVAQFVAFAVTIGTVNSRLLGL